MKKILWTITAVGALAVPVGLAAAQTDDETTETDRPTTVECDQEQLREQQRLQDGSGDRTHTQQRLQAQECDECDRAQVREQVRVEEGRGEMVREQVRVEEGRGEMVREQARVEEGRGEMVREQVRVEEGRGDMVRDQARVEACDSCTGDQTRTRAAVEDTTDPGAGGGQQATRRYQEQDHVPGIGNEDAPARAGR